jgi:Flp pilus assembly protein TadG
MIAAVAPSRRSLSLRLLRRLARQECGIAAVEFSLILPILVMLWIGGVEITQALSVDRRLNNLASATGDLVARSKIVTWADVDNIFDIAPGALFPYSIGGLQMRVTAVKMDEAGDAEVAWSRAEGTTAYATSTDVNDLVPESLRVPDTQIIMAEVGYTYTPAVGYVITGDLDLGDRMFFVPRLVANVQLCESNPPATNCQS